MSKLIAIVMAAGHGTRMKSRLPKVVHPACGRPLVFYPVRAALELGAEQVVVVVNPQSHQAVQEGLAAHIDEGQISFAIQEVPQGTGDAARVGLARVELNAEDRVLILSGDTPLLTSEALQPLLDSLATEVGLSFMYFCPQDPHGYGRVVRNQKGQPISIIEQRDIREPAHEAISEVNAGVYLGRAEYLEPALRKLTNENAQKEYYLTDVVAHVAACSGTAAVEASATVLSGVNDRMQLREVEQELFARIARHHAENGVSMVGTPLIDDTVQLSTDVRLEDGVRLRGRTSLGAGTWVDVGTVITDSVVGEDAHVKPYCVLTDSRVGNGVQLGPFAHLRPKSVLGDRVHVGNFVETKNSELKEGAKANHLAYLGDAEVGSRSNLGAGTIVCNYDGFMKRRTKIGADVFVGSDSQLIAPVTLGDGAYVATGTTVTNDVPEGALAIGRSRQENKPGYAEPLRDRLRSQAEVEKSKK